MDKHSENSDWLPRVDPDHPLGLPGKVKVFKDGKYAICTWVNGHYELTSDWQDMPPEDDERPDDKKAM